MAAVFGLLNSSVINQRLLGFNKKRMGRSHELGGRSVNSRFVLVVVFFRNVEKRDGFCKAPFHLGGISSPFFFILRCYHWLITFPTLAFLLLCYGLKMHYLLPICKERFSFHTALSLLSHLIFSSFDFKLRSSIFAYQKPLFFFLFSYECGFSMCVFVIRICMEGFRITRRRNGLAR